MICLGIQRHSVAAHRARVGELLTKISHGADNGLAPTGEFSMEYKVRIDIQFAMLHG